MAEIIDRAVLELTTDPTQLYAGLEGVKAKTAEVKSGVDQMGKSGSQNMKQLADDAKRPVENLRYLAQTVGIAFSVGAVVAFGKELLADADALVKLHDTTGISITGLQRFQIAGDDAGNTVDQISAAIVQLENRIASGDKSALAALAKLGLNFEQFKQLKPEDQFIAISDALRKVQDPAVQVQVSMDLFGKTGAAVLPTLKRGFDDLKGAAVGMSEDTVRAMDEAGDALDRWYRMAKGYAAESVVFWVRLARDGFDVNSMSLRKMKREMEDITAQAADMVKAATGGSGPAGFTNSPLAALAPSEREVKRFEDAADDIIKNQKKVREDAKKTTEQMEEAVAKMHQALVASDLQAFNTEPITRELDYLKERLALLGGVRDINKEIAGANTQRDFDLEGMTADLERARLIVNTVFVGPLEEGAAGHIAGKLATNLAHGLGPALIAAFQGGGDVGKSVGGYIGNQIGEELGSMAGKAIGGSLGAMAGSVIPIFGTIIGAWAGSAIGSMFSNPEATINPVREQFVQLSGGLGRLNERANEAGLTLAHLLDAKNPQQYQAAIEELNKAFQFQDLAMRTLDETVQRYNLTQDQLGDPARAENLHQQAVGYVQDWEVLRAAGVDYSTIVAGAGDTFVDMVQRSIASGVTMPESLRPMIQRAIEMGLILDDNGVAFGSVEEAGITFADSVGASMDSLIDQIHLLVEAITHTFEGGLTAAERHAQDFQSWLAHNPLRWAFDEGDMQRMYDAMHPTGLATGGFVGATGVQRFAAGGQAMGTDTVPAWLTPGELVLNGNQQAAVGHLLRRGGSAGSGVGELRGEIRELRSDLARDRRSLPGRLARAIGQYGQLQVAQ